MSTHTTPPMTAKENASIGSPTQDHGPRFGKDQSIRKRGYTIKRRPEKGEPVWEKGGVEFTHGEVLVREGLDHAANR